MQIFFQLLYVITHAFIQLIQPFLVPICFVMAWAIVAIAVWSIWSAIRDSVKRAQRMHQIPCSQCRYFSGNYLLKCPVHPGNALTEEAIGCSDFEASTVSWQLARSIEKDT
ncbi:MAG: hypothetical protein AAFQ89_23865 [Cyanobacteria bacterium J06626_18]